jgi:small subunit ribosomal protein S13
MPRILGVDIPNNKPTHVALTYLFGVGRVLAVNICYELDIDPQIRASDLSEDEVSRITNHLGKNYTVEGPLRRKVQQDIGRLREIQCQGRQALKMRSLMAF